MQPQLHYLKTLWLLQAIENFCQIPIVAPTSVFLKVQKQKLEFNSNYLAVRLVPETLVSVQITSKDNSGPLNIPNPNKL